MNQPLDDTRYVRPPSLPHTINITLSHHHSHSTTPHNTTRLTITPSHTTPHTITLKPPPLLTSLPHIPPLLSSPSHHHPLKPPPLHHHSLTYHPSLPLTPSPPQHQPSLTQKLQTSYLEILLHTYILVLLTLNNHAKLMPRFTPRFIKICLTE